MGPHHRSLRARNKPRAPGAGGVSPSRKQVPLHSVGLRCRRPSPAQRAQAHRALVVDLASVWPADRSLYSHPSVIIWYSKQDPRQSGWGCPGQSSLGITTQPC